MFGISPSARSSGALESGDLDLMDPVSVPVAKQKELTRLIVARPQRDMLERLFEFAGEGNTPTTQLTAARCLDIAAAMLVLVILAPLMVFIALAIALISPGPILFRQERLGLAGRRFRCLKFRTMKVDAEARLADFLARDPAARAEWHTARKLRNDPRVSRLGSMLRKTSLDELPQLFNVFAGDMSFVGPRPIVVDEICRYGRHIRSYYAVKPGITGLWQINGRNHTSYRRRVACDLLYVQTKSVYRDLRIIVLTIPVVLLGRGAY